MDSKEELDGDLKVENQAPAIKRQKVQMSSPKVEPVVLSDTEKDSMTDSPMKGVVTLDTES